MKNCFLLLFLSVSLSFAISGCAYNATVMSTSAPVAEIRTDKQCHKDVSYYIGSELHDLYKEVKPASYVCSAHKFPLEVGGAIESSIIKVLKGTFDNVSASASKNPSEGDGAYKFIFSLDSFRPILKFSMGFWAANITAQTEIVMKVLVIDSSGKEVVRTTISGEGAADLSGQCGAGADVLQEATEKAVERALDNFVYKVINSDYFVSVLFYSPNIS